jgi:RNA polymerase sigma-B factor
MGRPADAAASELDQLDDEELLHEIRLYPPDSPRRNQACEALVGRYRGLVRACANRYRRSPEPTEDLVQVGYVGLLKAINNFDPGVGRNLAAYAQPCITGEIKRYFRDKRWQVHIERPVQERLLELREAARELTQQLGAE